LHVLEIDVAFVLFVVEGEHLSETGQTSLGQHSLLTVFLAPVGSGTLPEVEVCCVLFAPAVYDCEVEGGEVGVYFEEKLFEGDFSVLVLIEEVVKTGSHAFHMIVLFLTETIYEILNRDGLFAS
jgi:hypothetical protein